MNSSPVTAYPPAIQSRPLFNSGKPQAKLYESILGKNTLALPQGMGVDKHSVGQPLVKPSLSALQCLSPIELNPKFGLLGCGVCLFCVLGAELAKARNQIGMISAGDVVVAGGSLNDLLVQRNLPISFKHVDHFDNSRPYLPTAFDATRIGMAAYVRDWSIGNGKFTKYQIPKSLEEAQSGVYGKVTQGLVMTKMPEHVGYGDEMDYIPFDPEGGRIKQELMPGALKNKFKTFTLIHQLNPFNPGERSNPFSMGYLCVTHQPWTPKELEAVQRPQTFKEMMIYSTREFSGLEGPKIPVAAFLNALGLATQAGYQSLAIMVEPYQDAMMNQYFNEVEERLTKPLRPLFEALPELNSVDRELKVLELRPDQMPESYKTLLRDHPSGTKVYFLDLTLIQAIRDNVQKVLQRETGSPKVDPGHWDTSFAEMFDSQPPANLSYRELALKRRQEQIEARLEGDKSDEEGGEDDEKEMVDRLLELVPKK